MLVLKSIGSVAFPPKKKMLLLAYDAGVDDFVAVFPENVAVLSKTTVYVPAAACPSNNEGSDEPTENTMPLAMTSDSELRVIFLNNVVMVINIAWQ